MRFSTELTGDAKSFVAAHDYPMIDSITEVPA